VSRVYSTEASAHSAVRLRFVDVVESEGSIDPVRPGTDSWVAGGCCRSGDLVHNWGYGIVHIHVHMFWKLLAGIVACGQGGPEYTGLLRDGLLLLGSRRTCRTSSSVFVVGV